MDIKYIKVGKWYNVPFKVVEIKSGDIHMGNGGIKAVCQPSELSEITSVERTERLWNGMCDVLFDDNGQKYAEDLSKSDAKTFKSMNPDTANGIKNTETATKYDPNRIFRKGDIVEMDTHGRNFSKELKKHGLKLCVRYTVTKDESADGHVAYTGDDGVEHLSMFFWLKLVTPVEELEPYIVVDAHTHWDVADKNMKTVAMYSKGNHPNAKAAAEAERDRLNAEYRKEQGNGQNG